MPHTSVRSISVRADFGSLVADVYGSGPVDAQRVVGPAASFRQGGLVVVWPSVLSTAAVQQRLVDELARQCVVVAVDPPGHGRSRIEYPSELTMAACSQATWDLVDAAGRHADPADAGVGPDVRWVGTSWGGLVGIEAAYAAPERLSHLACLNTPFAFTPPTLLRRAWLPTMARWMGTSGVFAALTARHFFLSSTRRSTASAAAMEAHRSTFTSGDRAQLAAALRLVFVERESALPRLPEVTTPTLVIAGDQDGLPVEAQREVALTFPRGSFEVVAAAHIAAVDATSQVLTALRRAWAGAAP